MKKRIISIWLTLSLVLSCMVAMPISSGAAELKPADVAVEAGLLKNIGLLSGTPEAQDGNKAMSRADFAVLAGSVIGINPGTATVRYFEDVPMDHWATAQINGLTERNILSIPADKLFRPSEKITKSEAVKIMISILGYGDYAAMSGGYPNGYAQVASKLDFDITGGTENLTQYEAIILVYDALNSCLYEKTAAGGGYINYEESDETLLSKYFDIYAAEGLVTQSEGVSLYEEPKLGKTFAETSKIVMIDGVEYTSDVNLYDYLGRMVRVYYVQEDEDDTPHIVFKEDYKKDDEVVEIDFEDYQGYENSTITYYNDNGRKETEKIDASAVIINNGSVEDSNILKAFSKYEDAEKTVEKKGKIRLVDTEDDGTWDVVFIQSAKNVFTASVNATTYQIFDEIELGHAIKLDEQERIVRIEDASGNIKTFEDVKKGQLLTIYESDDYIRVIINSAGISANIIDLKQEEDEVSLNLGKKEADAEWYDVDKKYYNQQLDGKVTLTKNMAVTYYCDAFGEVAYLKVTQAGDWQIGFLVKLFSNEDDDSTNMKIFMQDGTMKRYNVAEKVTVDGVVKKSYQEIYDSLNKITVQGKKDNPIDYMNPNESKPNPDNPDAKWTSVYDENEHEVFGQVIRIKRNAEDEITHIDSEFYNVGREDELTLQRTSYRKLDGTKGYHWLWKAHNYATTRWTTTTVHDTGFNLFYDANTIRFRVPRYADMETASDRQYSLASSTNLDLSEEDGNRDVEGYKVGFNSGYEAVIVRYEGAGQIEESDPALVGNVGKVVREDGETVLQAEVYAVTGGKTTIIAEEENSFSVLNDKGEVVNQIGKGDVITYKKNAEGNVETVAIYHDYSVNKGMPTVEEQGWIKGTAAQQDTQYTVCAYIKRYIDGIVFLRYPGAYSNAPFSADEMSGTDILRHDYAAPVMGGTAWVFDGREVRPENLADYIESAEMLGFENSRPCFLTINISRVNGGLFYENYED